MVILQKGRGLESQYLYSFQDFGNNSSQRKLLYVFVCPISVSQYWTKHDKPQNVFLSKHFLSINAGWIWCCKNYRVNPKQRILLIFILFFMFVFLCISSINFWLTWNWVFSLTTSRLFCFFLWSSVIFRFYDEIITLSPEHMICNKKAYNFLTDHSVNLSFYVQFK